MCHIERSRKLAKDFEQSSTSSTGPMFLLPLERWTAGHKKREKREREEGGAKTTGLNLGLTPLPWQKGCWVANETLASISLPLVKGWGVGLINLLSYSHSRQSIHSTEEAAWKECQLGWISFPSSWSAVFFIVRPSQQKISLLTSFEIKHETWASP